MYKLTKEDIQKNRVNTISQYYILDYLKKHLSINEFKIYLIDRNVIKVVDKTDDSLYFSYDNEKRQVIYQEDVKEIEHEISL